MRKTSRKPVLRVWWLLKGVLLLAGLASNSVVSAGTLSVACSTGDGVINESSATKTSLSCAGSGDYQTAQGTTYHNTSASVDLATGTIRVLASHEGPYVNQAQASATFTEGLTIVGGSGLVPLTVNFTLEGSATGIEPNRNNKVTSDVRFTNASGAVLENVYTLLAWGDSGVGILEDPAGTSSLNSSGNGFELLQSLTYTLDLDKSRNIFLTSTVFSWTYSATIDMTKTGLVKVILPEGLSFDSDSGVFLTESPNTSPVPLPAAAPLLASALGVFFFQGRRKFR